MLKETHVRIASFIAQELNLSPRASSLLIGGSVSPDSWADFPHHHGKEKDIVKNIMEARRQFMEDDDECYHKLGVALHYIQDMWTLRPRVAEEHTSWERSINRERLVDDSELEDTIKSQLFPTKVEQAYVDFVGKLKMGIGSVETPAQGQWEVRSAVGDERFYRGSGLQVVYFALQKRPTGWSSPIIDYNLAYRISHEVARNVLSKEIGQGIWFDFRARANDEAIVVGHQRAEWAKRQKRAGQQGLLAMIIFASFVVFGIYGVFFSGSPILIGGGVVMIIIGLCFLFFMIGLVLDLGY